MIEQLKKVEQFQEIFGIENNYKPCLIGEKGYELRYKLGLEELDEYLEACKNNDKVAILDALTDQLYILYGTILRHGMQDIIVKAFDEVDRSNLSKLDENGKAIHREDGKIIKSKNYSRPELKHLINE